MSERLFPNALKPAIVGFAIGFALVGLSRLTESRDAVPDKVVHLHSASPKIASGHWVKLR